MASGLLSILLGLLATQAPAVFPAVLPLLLCLALGLTHILPNVIFKQSLRPLSSAAHVLMYWVKTDHTLIALDMASNTLPDR
jgi:hypothetical protein